MRPHQAPIRRADGNTECVMLLERWLKRAKDHGQMAVVAIVASDGYSHVATDVAGCVELVFPISWGLDTVKQQLRDKSNSKHEEKFTSPNPLSSDRIAYDVSVGPACYDWISWLVLAEMNRRRQGGPAPLKVGFRMIDSDEERVKHARDRESFYKRVIFPSLCFVGAVADDASSDAPALNQFCMRPLVELCNRGVKVPLLVPPEEAVESARNLLYATDRRAPVTITLREVEDRWEFRNSNTQEWIRFARYLESTGERVVFIRDTGKASDPIEDFQTCPLASTDVRVRLAVYEEAKANLFVSNGPWMLALFGSRPWLMFVETNPMSPFFPETPQFWKEWHGIHHDQFPWSRSDQRIVWKRDNYETLVDSWEQLSLQGQMREAAE